MASAQEVEALKQLTTRLQNIDKDQLFRPQLGGLSLSGALEPFLSTLTERASLALEGAPDLPDNIVSSFRSSLESIVDTLVAQTKRSDTDYVNSREATIQAANNQLSTLLQGWTHFVSAAIERKHFLQTDEAFRTAIQASTDQAAKIVEEARKYAADLEERAKKIEAQARSTAAGVSFEVVQNEFRAAQSNLFKKVLLWGGLSALSFLGFIAFAWYIVIHPPLLAALASRANLAPSSPQSGALAGDVGSQGSWVAVYLAIIRITILTAIGAATAFMLKMFRAHLHMNEYNLHRQRVVNSLPVLVQAAENPEQRDQILGRLIDLVAGFGNSGILQNEDDSFSAPKMTIDAVMKNLSGGK